MNIKKELTMGLWRSDVYYQMAKKGSLDTNHPGVKALFNLREGATNILDLGCGEGSRLNLVTDSKYKGTGIDISSTAIRLAKKNFPKLTFFQGDLERTQFRDNSFDLVYSAYVLEHLSNPTKILSEAIRLTARDGYLVLIAPNYGAPNRCSPPFKGSRLIKFIIGLLKDLFSLFNLHQTLDWNQVKPIGDEKNYNIDWDTTIEPYIGSLLIFLKKKNMKIREFNSCWSEELKIAKAHQKVFRFLGELGLYPFLMWGPHLVVIAQKV